MSCYNPVELFKALSGPSKKTGKTPLRSLKMGGDIKQPVMIPCGRCTECLFQRSRQWAIRCMNEAQMHQENCFITLTYNDDNLVCGEHAYTLYPRDLQLFMKRLRKEVGDGIKFFACGEYGDSNRRPHYHACIFGYDFSDEKKSLISEREGVKLYTHPLLTRLWPAGFSTVGAVTLESAAYVARYTLKKKYGKKAKYYEKMGIEPEFIRMSRRPGIGTTWFEKFQGDVFPHDYIVTGNGIKQKPPKYYLEKYGLTNPEEYTTIKDTRKKEAEKRPNYSKQKHHATKVIKNQKLKQLTRNL